MNVIAQLVVTIIHKQTCVFISPKNLVSGEVQQFNTNMYVP